MNVTDEFDARPEVSQGQVVPLEEGYKSDPGWLEACLIVSSGTELGGQAETDMSRQKQDMFTIVFIPHSVLCLLEWNI